MSAHRKPPRFRPRSEPTFGRLVKEFLQEGGVEIWTGLSMLGVVAVAWLLLR